MRAVIASLVAVVLASVVPAAAQTETLTAVCTGPWEVKLNLNGTLNVPADELIEVPAAGTEWGYAVYGVFKAGDDTATLLVDLTPVSMYQQGNSTVEISTQFMVWYLTHKPRVYCKHCRCDWFWAIEEQSPTKSITLLALALEPKKFPIGETVTLVNPDQVQVDLGGKEVTLTRDVLEKVCEAVATYEYGMRADVGRLQYVVFKNLLTYASSASTTSTSTTTTTTTATSTTSTSTSTTETTSSTSTTSTTSTTEQQVTEEAAQLTQQFAEVNSSEVQEEVQDVLSELGVVVQQIASNPQVQQAASTASNLFQSVPLYPLALLGLVVPVFGRRR